MRQGSDDARRRLYSRADHRGRGDAAVVSGMWLNGFIVYVTLCTNACLRGTGLAGERARVGLSAAPLAAARRGGRRRGVDFDDGHS